MNVHANCFVVLVLRSSLFLFFVVSSLLLAKFQSFFVNKAMLRVFDGLIRC